MRVPWLADVLRSSGCVVVEAPGWKGRGRDLTAVNGVVAHHTASGPRTSDDAVVRLLIEGRSDLKGPLCQLGLDRRGRFHVIADGKGNHNGYGQWGNQSIGIEAFNDGVGERWPDVQVDAYKVGVAAILTRLGLPPSAVKGHKETDPGRKIDPAGIDMGGFRLSVAQLMAQPTAGPPPPTEDDDMTPEDRATLNRIGLIVTQLQQEVVGTTDGKGDTRHDRLVDLVLDVRRRVIALESKVG